MPKHEVEVALKLAKETKDLRIGSNILPQTIEVFKEQFPGRKAIVIADPNTYRVAGETVQQLFEKEGISYGEPFIITDPSLYADYKFVTVIKEYLQGKDGIAVAVGSGVINDITKRATGELETPYMCVATAASMDGYTSYGASITKDGAKKTMSCPAPQAAIADLEVIRYAPTINNASGFADLYAKVPAGADWILADVMGIEPLDETSWHIVQDGLADALKDPEGVKSGNLEAIEPLVEGLMLGGFAMQSLSSSRPASGAEHQFSHLWDMEHLTFKGEMAKKFGLYKNRDEQGPSHGFKVGIGTLAITALYERMLNTPMDQLDVKAAVDKWETLDAQIAKANVMFKGSGLEEFVIKQITDKYVSKEELEKQLNALKNNWHIVKEKIEKQIIPYQETKRRLKQVGAPVECEEIGVSRERLKESFFRTPWIRDRFTILDVAWRTNNLDKWVDELFSATGVLRG